MANPSIDDTEEFGILGSQANQVEAYPIAEEAVGGDNAYDNVEEVEAEVIYVVRVFNDEDEAYDAYNS